MTELVFILDRSGSMSGLEKILSEVSIQCWKSSAESRVML